jgi:hypothetical protein
MNRLFCFLLRGHCYHVVDGGRLVCRHCDAVKPIDWEE